MCYKYVCNTLCNTIRCNVFCRTTCIVCVYCTPLCQLYEIHLDMPHQGEILQEAIKNSGVSITRIVDELGITRPTIYRKFKDESLDYSFVKRVGEIINHDFSNDFTNSQQSTLSFVTPIQKQVVTTDAVPRVTGTASADLDPSKQLLILQTKYIALLEAYNELLLKVYGPK